MKAASEQYARNKSLLSDYKRNLCAGNHIFIYARPQWVPTAHPWRLLLDHDISRNSIHQRLERRWMTGTAKWLFITLGEEQIVTSLYENLEFASAFAKANLTRSELGQRAASTSYETAKKVGRCTPCNIYHQICCQRSPPARD